MTLRRLIVINNHEPSLWRQTILPSLSLFTSIGTLLCCALPALLVTIGMGAALAGLVSNAPWITTISYYKSYIFAVAGILITIASIMQWKARNAPCPADPAKAKICSRLRKVSWIILIAAILIYCIGLFFSYFAADIFYG